MGKFYTVPNSIKNGIRLYSERGLLAYLFHHMMLQDPRPVLSAAKSSDGKILGETLDMGELESHTVYTEFDLGAEGFGCPDGGLLLTGKHGKAFVFIEGKAILFALSFYDPEQIASQIKEVDWDSSDIESLVSQNKFNSSINGQLELKWRFINALQTFGSLDHGARTITEQNVQLPDKIIACDRFYWRRRLKPRKDHPADWRRVDVGGDLRPLSKDLQGVQAFCLLSITADTSIPDDLLRRVRLFTKEGEPLPNAGSFLFWLPLNFIEARLEKL